ncbi:hypothetical protein [Streptomyces thermolilacinus]|uniref:DAD domain-containing protein n=1 Tax=Streptomyces thermolilacinus SPC6 TaxID=1306406 RepID=A0A1D3DW45_9ACTN|nr:hypothetical protein [Streptomyces thermolilacinus]OEJ96519.1 hypothetical protein J116_020775 [Streptomyces thermolilacinus SPC6]
MTTADQETSGKAPAQDAENAPAKAPEPATPDPRETEKAEKAEAAETAAPEADAARAADGAHGAGEGRAPDEQSPHDGLTPRQARRLRVVVATVVLVTLAAVLALRLASRTSVLVVGVYGLAMILCGVVIELSRHGRTRLGTWLLGTGLLAALAADWLLLP